MVDRAFPQIDAVSARVRPWGRSRSTERRPTVLETTSPTIPTMTYRLDCNDCDFERLIEVEIDELFDVIEDHREEYEADRSEHFVDFERVPERAES